MTYFCFDVDTCTRRTQDDEVFAKL